MKTSAPYNFQFQAQELPQKLSQLSQEKLTGYWLFEFPALAGTEVANLWYLGLSQGKVIFSGNQQCCWSALFETLQRYTTRLRSGDAKHAILRVEEQLTRINSANQSAALLTLLNELKELNLLKVEELQESLRLRTLSDFDTYLFEYAGQAHFLPSSQMGESMPILGFDMETMLLKAKERRVVWHKVKRLIPSMERVPVLNVEVVKASHLNMEQKQRLESLVSSNKTLNDIAVLLAQDLLEIAKFFAKLITESLVTLRSSPVAETVEVFVVDDSPVLLRQFESLVTSWGYRVHSFYEPMLALQALSDANPTVIFLDINMPEVTGFDLVKQIRRLPGLESVPLIMLTAEKSLSNNWRARWSGCQFMSKPLTPGEIPAFRLELRTLLTELAPLNQPAQLSSTRTGFQMETSY